MISTKVSILIPIVSLASIIDDSKEHTKTLSEVIQHVNLKEGHGKPLSKRLLEQHFKNRKLRISEKAKDFCVNFSQDAD